MEGEWAELVPGHSWAVAMGCTGGKRNQSHVWKQAVVFLRKAEHKLPCQLVYWKGVGVENESSHTSG